MSFYSPGNIDARSVPSFTGAAGRTSLVAETFPRYHVTGSIAPTAGVVHWVRIHLLPGAYTTLICHKGATQGATLTNTFFGLYSEAFARLAVSADVSTDFAAVAASAAAEIPLSYTVTAESDFLVAMLVGSASSMPTLYRNDNVGVAAYSMDPKLIGQHNTGSQTALPSTLTNANPGSAQNYWYFRYEA